MEFGDELVMESYRIPWLIWIQLLVMCLLGVLLYYLSISPSDLYHHSTGPIESSSLLVNDQLLSTSTAINFRNLKSAGENQINQVGTSSNLGIRGGHVEPDQQGEGSLRKDASHHGIAFGNSYHPCHFFGLAKQAFLKCLGFDSRSEASPKRNREKDG